MFFDYSSLLVATAVAALAAGLTLTVSWLSDRTGRFLATCTGAITAIIISIGFFLYYSATFSKIGGFLACATLIVALGFAFAGASYFRIGQFSTRNIAGAVLALITLSTLPYLAGYDGLSFILFNAAAAGLIAASGREFWLCHDENSALITSISALFGLLSISFAACSLALAITTPLVLDGPPNNWAESFNMAVSILSVTGIGALYVALNHQRAARRHFAASQTDALTGLLNRRALFDLHGDNGLPPRTTAIMFDLDNFKRINDEYGHGIGDNFLSMFAEMCRQKLRPIDKGVRLGGEEFIAILPDTDTTQGAAMAEIIRIAFAKQIIDANGQEISCTVSAGVYTNDTLEDVPLDLVLRTIDDALYRAKRSGRNVVRIEKWLSTAA